MLKIGLHPPVGAALFLNKPYPAPYVACPFAQGDIRQAGSRTTHIA